MAGNLTAMIASIFSGGVTADPFYEYTTLLLPGNGTNGAQNNTFLDGSTNNFTITRNGNTTQGTFSPFSQTGWGNYFSANTSELSFASNAAFNLSGVSWTIEFWAYPTENAPARDRNWITRRQASGGFTSSYQIYCGSGANTLKFLVTGQTVVTSTSSLTPNQWNHVAVVWNGTTLYFFINGVQDATTGTYGAGTGADAQPLRIGRLATNDNVLSYMSNVRVVKGVAVYTGNFTVPSTPLALTQSSGTNISAITGTQTSLLTCQSNRFVDVTANAFVPTVGTGTSVQAFSPFNPTASWSAATNGGSGYFDGNGDYLSVPNSTNLNSTGDFTIEGWAYITNASSYAGMFSMRASTGTTNGASITFINTGYIEFAVNPGGNNLTTPTPLNQWFHVALVRSGSSTNNCSCYLNGTRVAQFTSTSQANGASNGAVIGRYYADGTNQYWVTGYLSNVRYVVGTAVYSGATITVPTTPLTAISGTQFLCNFTNAGIYDATSKNDLETVGNAQISTTQSKWGGSSMSFDGTGDYLLSPAPPGSLLDLKTGDYTIESWIYYPSATAGFQTICGIYRFGDVNVVQYYFGVSSTNKLSLGIYASVSTFQTVTSSGNVPTSNWTHVAVTKSGTTLRLFINGTIDGTATITIGDLMTLTAATQFSAGALRDGSGNPYSYLNGYLQDLRITKGYARYTANFTPPTAAFPTL